MLQGLSARPTARLPVPTGIVTDRPTTGAALARILGEAEHIAFVGSASIDEAETLLAHPDLRVLLVNLSLGLVNDHSPGTSFIKQCKERRHDVRVLSLKRRVDEAQARAALDAGADACCLAVADASRLIRAIEVVDSGATWLDAEITNALFRRERRSEPQGRPQLPQLSPRERQVLELLIEGHSNHEIGQHLHCAVPTVRTHLSNLYRKIGVEDRVSAAVFGLRHGLA